MTSYKLQAICNILQNHSQNSIVFEQLRSKRLFNETRHPTIVRYLTWVRCHQNGEFHFIKTIHLTQVRSQISLKWDNFSPCKQFIPDCLTYNHFHNVWGFLMFYTIFLSTQVRQSAIISNKYDTYKLPNKLPNHLKLRKLGNIWKRFFNTSKKVLKIRN